MRHLLNRSIFVSYWGFWRKCFLLHSHYARSHLRQTPSRMPTKLYPDSRELEKGKVKDAKDKSRKACETNPFPLCRGHLFLETAFKRLPFLLRALLGLSLQHLRVDSPDDEADLDVIQRQLIDGDGS